MKSFFEPIKLEESWVKDNFKEIHKPMLFLLVSLVGVIRDNTDKTKSLTSCFSAWAKKADVDTEGALLAALDTKEEIPIIPYSSLFILSSENKYDNSDDLYIIGRFCLSVCHEK